jgi:hypothetical protein
VLPRGVVESRLQGWMLVRVLRLLDCWCLRDLLLEIKCTHVCVSLSLMAEILRVHSPNLLIRSMIRYVPVYTDLVFVLFDVLGFGLG